MIRIEKHTQIGNKLIDTVLSSAWSITNERYEGDLYYGLMTKTQKEQIKNLLLQEQNNLCCYCLKEIELEILTIEHIIPQQVNSHDEFTKYLVVQELTDFVIHKDEFDRNKRNIPPDKYPHDLAYNNLIASCNSNGNCNKKRHNRFVYPIVYNNKLVQEVSYEPNGIMFVDEVELDALNLNSDNLKMIRRVWYLIAKKVGDDVEFESIEKLTALVEDVIINESTEFIEKFYNVKSSIINLLKYKWFLKYYSENLSTNY